MVIEERLFKDIERTARHNNQRKESLDVVETSQTLVSTLRRLHSRTRNKRTDKGDNAGNNNNNTANDQHEINDGNLIGEGRKEGVDGLVNERSAVDTSNEVDERSTNKSFRDTK